MGAQFVSNGLVFFVPPQSSLLGDCVDYADSGSVLDAPRAIRVCRHSDLPGDARRISRACSLRCSTDYGCTRGMLLR